MPLGHEPLPCLQEILPQIQGVQFLEPQKIRHCGQEIQLAGSNGLYLAFPQTRYVNDHGDVGHDRKIIRPAQEFLQDVYKRQPFISAGLDPQKLSDEETYTVVFSPSDCGEKSPLEKTTVLSDIVWKEFWREYIIGLGTITPDSVK